LAESTGGWLSAGLPMNRVGSCPADAGSIIGCSSGGWECGELLERGTIGIDVWRTGGPSIIGLPGWVGNCGEFDKTGGDMLAGGGILREFTVDLEGPGGRPTLPPPPPLLGDIFCLFPFGLDVVVLALRVGIPE
jgi:hypothetical protein